MHLLLLCFVPLVLSTSWGAEPKPDIVSPLTLLAEENQLEGRIEDPSAIRSAKGRVANVAWEQLRVEPGPPGDGKKSPLGS